MNRVLLIFYFSFFLASPLFALGIEHQSNSTILKNYNLILKKFNRELCSGGTEEDFWKKYKEFRGDGFYIPTTHNEKVDFQVLNKFLPELSRKKQWILSELQKVEKIKNYSTLHDYINSIRAILNQLLQYKHDYLESKDDNTKKTAITKSKYLMIELKNKYLKLTQHFSFLTSYRFPVNHFELRENYDLYKHRTDKEGRSKSNEIYFYRKIVQDGAQNPNNTSSDTFLRSAIDTTFSNLNKSSDILSENIRYDLTWILDGLKLHVDRGKEKQLSRLKEWFERTDRMIDFYRLLTMNKVKQGNKFASGEEVIQQLSKARYTLKDTVLSKQRDVYFFWMNQDPLYRAIYSLETILFNEVGTVDGKDALERRDVAQVAWNRHQHSFYSSLTESDDLYPYLISKDSNISVEKYPWLNVLLKEGEFSFTYFFIPGSLRVYCPEMTRRGRYLRTENVKIALETLRSPNTQFKGLRYFSRASMLGRIDMSSIWSQYKVINERPGKIYKNQPKLKDLHKKGKYTYLYHFKSPSNEDFQVMEIKNKTFVYSEEKELFYKYRNPHYFTYFEAL